MRKRTIFKKNSYPGADICAATGNREHDVTLKTLRPDTHLLFPGCCGYFSSWEVEKKVDIGAKKAVPESWYIPRSRQKNIVLVYCDLSARGQKKTWSPPANLFEIWNGRGVHICAADEDRKQKNMLSNNVPLWRLRCQKDRHSWRCKVWIFENVKY